MGSVGAPLQMGSPAQSPGVAGPVMTGITKPTRGLFSLRVSEASPVMSLRVRQVLERWPEHRAPQAVPKRRPAFLASAGWGQEARCWPWGDSFLSCEGRHSGRGRPSFTGLPDEHPLCSQAPIRRLFNSHSLMRPTCPYGGWS